MTAGRSLVGVLLSVVVAVSVVRLVGLDRGFPLVALMTVYPYLVAASALMLVAAEVTDVAVDALATAGLHTLLQNGEVLPSRYTSGGGIWSRHELRAREPSRRRGFGASPQVTIEVPAHGPLLVDAVHPLPPISAAAMDRGARRILVGDFNATLDHRALREVLDRGWVDAAAARGAGLHPTFHGLPMGEPVPPVTLDHVLVDQQVLVEDVRTRQVPGTDHRLVLVRLRLPAG